MNRNFQILPPLDFLAELTQHIPPKGSHLIRGHRPKVGRGWYSNKSRGVRKETHVAVSAALSSEERTTSRSRQGLYSWTNVCLMYVVEFNEQLRHRCRREGIAMKTFFAHSLT